MTKETRRIVSLAILSALGTVLMIIEIPYPVFPWLMLDLSDVVVLVVFIVYGWKEAALVGLLKVVIHGLFKGTVGPMYLGQLTAFIASMSYVLGMYLTTNKLNLNRFVSALISVGIVTFILTVANYYFITPSWLVYSYATIGDINGVDFAAGLGTSASMSYLVTILVIYVPFNLLKGAIVLGAFTAIYKSIGEFLKEYAQ